MNKIRRTAIKKKKFRDWVKPFLIRDRSIPYGELNEDRIYAELTYYFKQSFSGIGWGLILWVFGSVLAQLPKDVFDKFREMRNVFFVYTGVVNGSIKSFKRETKGEWITIINFAFDPASTPIPLMRRIIAHELAHLYLHFKPNKDPKYGFCVNYRGVLRQLEAEMKVMEWGFINDMEKSMYYDEDCIKCWKKRENSVSEEMQLLFYEGEDPED